jgi:hypothetical protein
VYVWEGRINVTSDHVHVYALEGESMLLLFMSICILCWGINITCVHVHVYVLGGNVAAVHINVYVVGGGSLLPMFMSMCMC